MPRLAAWVQRRSGRILAVAAVATVLLAIASMNLRFNPTLERLRSVTDAARLEERISTDFGLPKVSP